MLSRYCFIVFLSGGVLRGRFGRLVGRDDHAGGRCLGVDEAESRELAPLGKETAPGSQTSGWIVRTYWSTRLRRISDCTSSPLPSTTRSLPGCSLRLATASAASPLRSVEFVHESG